MVKSTPEGLTELTELPLVDMIKSKMKRFIDIEIRYVKLL